jgi:hypothetical protein
MLEPVIIAVYIPKQPFVYFTLLAKVRTLAVAAAHELD